MTPIASFISRFIRCAQGNVLMLTGLSFLFLVAAGGAGVDFGRQQLFRMKMQQASDAAALAAALLPPSATNQERTDVALRYFKLNYPASYLGSDRPEPQITIGDNITVQADKTIATNFISTGNVRVQQLDAQGRTVVQKARNGLTNYDVFLLMDNSGSMSATDVGSSNTTPATNIAQSTAAGTAACNNYYAMYSQVVCPTYPYPNQSYQNPQQCLVGEAQRLCNLALTTDAYTGASISTPQGLGLIGNTRLNALRYASLQLVGTLLGNSPDNRVGVVAWARENFLPVLDFTNNQSTVRTIINAMFAFDATNSTNPLVEAETHIDDAISADSTGNRVRAVVLLTDGVNTFSGPVTQMTTTGLYDANGCSGNASVMCTAANLNSLDVCTRLKRKNVVIYTIAFGPEVSSATPNGQQAQAFLRGCATPDTPNSQHFFPAANAVQLNAIFTTITTQIQNLRIAE